MMGGVQLKEVRKVRRSSPSDHTVANCSKSCILFCVLMATNANPQEGGNMFAPGNLANAASRTPHHKLNCVYKF